MADQNDALTSTSTDHGIPTDQTADSILDRQRKWREEDRRRFEEAEKRNQEAQQEIRHRNALPDAFSRLRNCGWLYGQQEDPNTLAATANEKAWAWIGVVGMLVERDHLENILRYIRNNNDSSFHALEIDNENDRLQEEEDRRNFLISLLQAGADRNEAEVTRLLLQGEEKGSKRFRDCIRSWIQSELENLTFRLIQAKEQNDEVTGEATQNAAPQTAGAAEGEPKTQATIPPFETPEPPSDEGASRHIVTVSQDKVSASLVGAVQPLGPSRALVAEDAQVSLTFEQQPGNKTAMSGCGSADSISEPAAVAELSQPEDGRPTNNSVSSGTEDSPHDSEHTKELDPFRRGPKVKKANVAKRNELIAEAIAAGKKTEDEIFNYVRLNDSSLLLVNKKGSDLISPKSMTTAYKLAMKAKQNCNSL